MHIILNALRVVTRVTLLDVGRVFWGMARWLAKTVVDMALLPVGVFTSFANPPVLSYSLKFDF